MNEKDIYIYINENSITVIQELLRAGYEIHITNDGETSKMLSMRINHIDFDDQRFISVTEDEQMYIDSLRHGDE